MPSSTIPTPSTQLFDYPKYWAECFGVAPFLPMSREEMDTPGLDSMINRYNDDIVQSFIFLESVVFLLTATIVLVTLL